MTTETLNYTVVAVGIIGGFAVGAWIVWAHRWFVGPVKEHHGRQHIAGDILQPSASEEAEAEGEKESGKKN